MLGIVLALIGGILIGLDIGLKIAIILFDKEQANEQNRIEKYY